MKRSTATEEAGSISSNSTETHPLPLNLDFMFGKGFLWAEDVALSDWLTLESLRMEIPDLSFPFDAGGGVGRFQQTRCQVREIELSVREEGLTRRLNRAASELGEFHDVRLQFLEDAAHVSLLLKAFGSESRLSFRAALVPPEPPYGDEVHLSLYDYRWFGPLPYPGRLLAFEWLTGILNSEVFSAPGRGRPFQIGVAGDIASLRPFKLLLIDLFPRHGWKMPNLSGVALDEVRMTPGALTIRATSGEEHWQSDAEELHELEETREGRRALAAYESKDLFASADEALFAGHVDQALDRLAHFREQYGLHPHLASRILDCLLADPTTGNLAEAEALCDELLEDNPRDLRAHLARPVLAQLSGGETATLEAFESLSSLLRHREDTHDWILSELAVADRLQRDAPRRAAERLREVLRATPHSLPVLERLRALYKRLGDKDQLEDVLKRLTGVYDDRERLAETYLELARHLMHREGEVAEARHYLEKALKIDEEDLQALETLGESYELSDKPMRAVKTFSAAARTAESRDQRTRARQLQFRAAKIWRDELDDPRQALLGVRRALSTTESELDAATSLDRPQAIEYAGQLEFAAGLCEQLDRGDEAIGHWSEVVNLLERLVDAEDVPSRAVGPDDAPAPQSPVGRLAAAHQRIASLYLARDRDGAAEHHWRRGLELDPTRRTIAEQLARLYRRSGETEVLVDFLEQRLRETTGPAESRDLHRQLADIFADRGDEERAEEHREHAERFDERVGEAPEVDDAWRHDAETAPLVDPIDEGDSDRAGSGAAEHREPEDEATSEALRATQEMEDPPGDRQQTEDDGASLAPPPEEFDARARPSAAETTRIEREPNEIDANSEEGNDGTSTRSSSTEAVDAGSLRERLSELDPEHETLPPEDSPTGEPATSDESGAFSSDFDTSSKTRNLSKIPAPVEDELDRPDDSEEEGSTDRSSGLEDEDEPTESDDGSLEDFRSEYEQLLNSRAADADEGRLPAPDGIEPSRSAASDPDLDDAPPSSDNLAETVRAQRAPDPRERIREARNGDDPERLAAVLEEILDARQRAPEQMDLGDEEALDLRKELAELLYYELEDGEAARRHLEQLHREDPEHRGGDESILRALETIYEEEGNAEGQIAILQTQREATDDPEMVRTYRLLQARVYWEELGGEDRARQLLRATLEEEPEHEGANRLMADIERESGNYESAADHLRTVADVAGGGLDALEVERKLADLLAEELEAWDEAAAHYERALEGAPGDSRALEGLQSCRRTLGDWEGYLECLAHEIGILTRRVDEIDASTLDAIDPDGVPMDARAPVSQILAEAGEILEEHLDQLERARHIYGLATDLWNENVEALERRMELDRELGSERALAEDLEQFANVLLDSASQSTALFEAAEVWQDLGETRRAIEPLERAVDIGESAEPEPSTLDDARALLDDLHDEVDAKGD